MVVLLLVLVPGCGFRDYEPKPLSTDAFPAQFRTRDLDSQELRRYLERVGYAEPGQPIREWGLTGLTLAGFYYSPELAVAEADWHLRRAGEITAGQRPNPSLSFPAEYHTDPSGDEGSPWVFGSVVDVLFEAPGKRDARRDRADALSLAGRIELEHAAWRLHSRVRQALIELRAARRRRDLLREEAELNEKTLRLLEERARAGQVSTFRVTTLRMDRARTRMELARQRGRIAEARHALAEAVAVPEEKLREVSLAFPEVQPGPGGQLDMERLRGLALRRRYDIRRAVAEYAAREAALRREIRAQYPDLSLSPGLLFDQSELVWMLGASWTVPLFNRNEGPIAEALARRRLARKRFLKLQTRVLQKLAERRDRYRARNSALSEARSLLRDARERQTSRRKQYKAGYLDRLALLRGRRELVRARRTVAEAETARRLALAGVRDALQRPLSGRLALDRALQPLIEETGADP
ncbi:TolC family protein [Thiohalorhabdus sp. Cl-TMA]|uniref:TolC family protein n=1 Tax=Thiohalorhabdus methylotrophus TaxID=3242694 RepID=A0ABV4TY44_9GAMM